MSTTVKTGRGRTGSTASTRSGARAPASPKRTGTRTETGRGGGDAALRHDRSNPAGTGAAARTVARRNSTQLTLPVLGKVALPPPDELAFLAGAGLLAAAGAVDWPVAVLLAVGHVLANRRNNRVLREFGEALERA